MGHETILKAKESLARHKKMKQLCSLETFSSTRCYLITCLEINHSVSVYFFFLTGRQKAYKYLELECVEILKAVSGEKMKQEQNFKKITTITCINQDFCIIIIAL